MTFSTAVYTEKEEVINSRAVKRHLTFFNYKGLLFLFPDVANIVELDSEVLSSLTGSLGTGRREMLSVQDRTITLSSEFQKPLRRTI